MLDKIEFIDAVIANDAEKVEHFLKNGMDPNITIDWAMLRPLHFAVQYNSVYAAIVLIQYGANPRAIDSCGDSPIDRALEQKQQNRSMLAVLSSRERKHWC